MQAPSIVMLWTPLVWNTEALWLHSRPGATSDFVGVIFSHNYS